MAKPESSLRNMALSLILITGFAGALLAWVYDVTKAPIAHSEKARQIEAVSRVAPPFDNSPLDESYKVAVAAHDSFTVFPAKKGGELVGAAVEAITQKGFSGVIKVMVGFDANGSIRNYVVLQHNETPGLGSKMQEWFSEKSKAVRCIIGRNPSTPLKVSKDGGDVDAITAATISSRALLDAVNAASQAYRSKTGAGAEDSVSVHQVKGK